MRTNDDGSQVYDWYYSVDSQNDENGVPYESTVKTQQDVRDQCADPSRYEEGAEFVMP